MLVDIFRESIQSTHLFINTWTQQLIKCKLLPSICSQLYVVWYGEIGSWTLVWFKVCLTTDSPSIVPTFCSGQVGRINVIDTSVRMICAESSWRTFRVSNNLNDFFSSIGLSFSFFIRSWATAQRTLFVSFQLHQPSSFSGPFPCSAPSSLGGPGNEDGHQLATTCIDLGWTEWTLSSNSYPRRRSFWPFGHPKQGDTSWCFTAFWVLRELASRLANPFDHPSRVRTQLTMAY